MQWSFVDKVNEGFETFLKLNRAKNLTEFERAVGSHHSPGLNFAAVDSEEALVFCGWSAGETLLVSVDISFRMAQVDVVAGIVRSRKSKNSIQLRATRIQPIIDGTFNLRWHHRANAGYFSPDDRWMRLDERLKESGRWDLSRRYRTPTRCNQPLERAMLKTGLEVEGMRTLIEASRREALCWSAFKRGWRLWD